jgi:hypothetical protein
VGTFAAVEKEIAGKAGIELSFRRSDYDQEPWRISLIIQKQLEAYHRFPAAYQFLEETEERWWPIIRVVAAPGLSVAIQNIPDTYVAGIETPSLEFFRVQDPEVLPPIAHDIAAMGLAGQEEVNPPVLAVPANMPSMYPENYFRIDRLPSEVVIDHPFSRTTLMIKVPEFTRDARDTRNARARFCYHVDPEGVLGSFDHPLVRIVKTPEVKLTVAASDTRFARITAETNLRQHIVFYEIFEVDDINAVPPQGAPIIPQQGWREVRSIERIPRSEEEIQMALMDTTVGLVPVVGDIVDVAELVYGVATGRDRWGRKVTTGDLVIMGIGALLPFVGSAALRGSERLIRRFGRQAQTVEELLESLRRASLSGDEATLIRQMEDLIRAGRHPTQDMYRRLSDVLRRVHGKYLGFDALLNAQRTGFTHPTLQAAYQEYRQSRVRSGQRPASPQEWAALQTRGASLRILEALLGPDYKRGIQRVLNARFINFSDIPRPVDLKDDQVQETLRLLNRESVKMTERLDSLIADRVVGGVITRFLATVRMNRGRFRILKGNLGEVLSMPIQREILARLAANNPSARLISGVRIRLANDAGKVSGASRLFTDNVIAVERNGNLHVVAVFEVKASYEGALDAQSQIFRWIEDRITPGSEIVLPKGTRVLSADGVERILQKERVFTHNPDPAASGTGRVIGLNSAERHIIAGRGSSHLGVDSPEQIAATVTRHNLPYSSAEMDYLAGQFAASRNW